MSFLLVIFVKLQIKGWSLTGGSFIQLSFVVGLSRAVEFFLVVLSEVLHGWYEWNCVGTGSF